MNCYYFKETDPLNVWMHWLLNIPKNSTLSNIIKSCTPFQSEPTFSMLLYSCIVTGGERGKLKNTFASETPYEIMDDEKKTIYGNI